MHDSIRHYGSWKTGSKQNKERLQEIVDILMVPKDKRKLVSDYVYIHHSNGAHETPLDLGGETWNPDRLTIVFKDRSPKKKERIKEIIAILDHTLCDTKTSKKTLEKNTKIAKSAGLVDKVGDFVQVTRVVYEKKHHDGNPTLVARNSIERHTHARDAFTKAIAGELV
jgi:hypothetical protein